MGNADSSQCCTEYNGTTVGIGVAVVLVCLCCCCCSYFVNKMRTKLEAEEASVTPVIVDGIPDPNVEDAVDESDLEISNNGDKDDKLAQDDEAIDVYRRPARPNSRGSLVHTRERRAKPLGPVTPTFAHVLASPPSAAHDTPKSTSGVHVGVHEKEDGGR